MNDTADRPNYAVRSVQLAIDILEAVALSPEEVGVTAIADKLHMTKGSVYRHLQTLVERGYLSQDSVTALYHLGPRSRLLAQLTAKPELIDAADGPMRELRNAVGQTVVLSEISPRGAVVLKAVPGPSPIEIGVRPGSELAFHSSAQGKVLLAYAPAALQERVLSSQMEAFTKHTICKRRQLETEITRTRTRGFASAPEETILGLNAIAAPVFDEAQVCRASIAIVGSIQFVDADKSPHGIKSLIKSAQLISNTLSYRFDPPIQGASKLQEPNCKPGAQARATQRGRARRPSQSPSR